MLDYDNDGWVDLFAVNGGALPGYAGERPLNGMFRNEGVTFRDVTERAGVGRTDYGMGCCAGDYDNDGDVDLYVTCYGRNALFRNSGDGTFVDVAREAGVTGDSTWSTGCTFLDYDRDGYLDLYVARYVVYALSDSERELIPYVAGAEKGRSLKRRERAYPHPINFHGISDVLYRNRGDGTFEEVTQQAGLSGKAGRGLGVIALDDDDDGDMDLYVANDVMANFLFRNEGGRFEEVALFAGVAYDQTGGAQASMGVDAEDYDGDGRLDLVVTNFQKEGTTLYHNDGSGFFTDVSLPVGVRRPSLQMVGWGVAFADFDNDGWLDLFSIDGHVLDNEDILSAEGTTHAQRRILLRNAGNGTFVDVSAEAGPGLEQEAVGRGAAFGDFDNDGDVDVFIINNNCPVTLLRNDTQDQNRWLRVKLVGGKRPETEKGETEKRGESLFPGSPAPRFSGSALSNRDGIGARVWVWAGGRGQVKEVRSGSSYLSQNDFRLHFGLGSVGEADSVVVRWPGGLIQRVEKVPSNRLLLVREGEGHEVR